MTTRKILMKNFIRAQRYKTMSGIHLGAYLNFLIFSKNSKHPLHMK